MRGRPSEQTLRAVAGWSLATIVLALLAVEGSVAAPERSAVVPATGNWSMVFTTAGGVEINTGGGTLLVDGREKPPKVKTIQVGLPLPCKDGTFAAPFKNFGLALPVRLNGEFGPWTDKHLPTQPVFLRLAGRFVSARRATGTLRWRDVGEKGAQCDGSFTWVARPR